MSVLGKIVDLDMAHGYGFIRDEDKSEMIFFHIRDVDKSCVKPHVNELVEFEIESDLNGCLLALNISPSLMQ